MKLVILSLIISSAAFTSSLKESLEQLRGQYNLPGLAAAFYQDGEIKEIEAVGQRKIGYDSPLKTTDKFYLASCTKSMTATVAAMLIEENYFDWDSTLQDLLPEYSISPKLKNVTFEMLLSHRAGLLRDTSNFQYGQLDSLLYSGWVDPLRGREIIAQTILAEAPEYQPGEVYEYSNVGYMIAGHIMEKLSGISWEMLMKQRLFKPLMMKGCGFGPTSNAYNSYPENTWGHRNQGGKLMPVHHDNPPTFGPAGTVHCTIQSWVKYLKIHLDGFNGKAKLLQKGSFNKLHTIYPAEGNEYTHGGWIRLYRNWASGDTLTHGGTNTYNFARVWLAPAHNAALISTSNISNNDAANATNEAIVALFKRNLTKEIKDTPLN